MIAEIILVIVSLVLIIGFGWLTVKAYMDFSKVLGLRKELKQSKEALIALQKDSTNYQIETERRIKKLEDSIELKSTSWRNNVGNEVNFHLDRKLPEAIRKTLSNVVETQK
tara:strand:- start:150 stop:482 length:333 start_codon:yes stop_codon:yes gene_type:complete